MQASSTSCVRSWPVASVAVSDVPLVVGARVGRLFDLVEVHSSLDLVEVVGGFSLCRPRACLSRERVANRRYQCPGGPSSASVATAIRRVAAGLAPRAQRDGGRVVAQRAGGQRTLVSLAVLLAAAQVESHSSVLLLDEVDAALDEHNQVGRWLSRDKSTERFPWACLKALGGDGGVRSLHPLDISFLFPAPCSAQWPSCCTTCRMWGRHRSSASATTRCCITPATSWSMCRALAAAAQRRPRARAPRGQMIRVLASRCLGKSKERGRRGRSDWPHK